MTLEEQLIRDEGLRLHAYRDSAGKLTIGIGRNLDDVGISRDEALYLAGNDITKARIQLAAELPWIGRLDPVRYDAMVNMCFNLGIGGLLSFRRFLAAMQIGDWKAASVQLIGDPDRDPPIPESLWAKQVGPRAHRLALQIETGEVQ